MDAVKLRRWAWPMHSIYKRAINGIMPEQVYRSFGEQGYGFWKRLLSQVINIAFYANDAFPWGTQLLILARRQEPAKPGVLSARGTGDRRE